MKTSLGQELKRSVQELDLQYCVLYALKRTLVALLILFSFFSLKVLGTFLSFPPSINLICFFSFYPKGLCSLYCSWWQCTMSLSTFCCPLLLPRLLHIITDFCLEVVKDLWKIFLFKISLYCKRFFPCQENSSFHRCLLSFCHCKSEIENLHIYLLCMLTHFASLPLTSHLPVEKQEKKKKACDANLHLFSYFCFPIFSLHR